MGAKYPLSVRRHIERRWAERIRLLRQIRGQIVVEIERALQRAINNKGPLILIPVRTVVDRRRPDQCQPRD
jgi:hypothetical protein